MSMSLLCSANVADLNVYVHIPVQVDFVLLVELAFLTLRVVTVDSLVASTLREVVGHQVGCDLLLPQVLSFLFLREFGLLQLLDLLLGLTSPLLFVQNLAC